MNYVSVKYDESIYSLSTDVEKTIDVYYWRFPVNSELSYLVITKPSHGTVKYKNGVLRLYDAEGDLVQKEERYDSILGETSLYFSSYGIAATYEEAVAAFNEDIMKRISYLNGLISEAESYFVKYN